MRKAFTIVEVLVVISILGLIMGVGTVNLRQFQRKQDVISAKRMLLEDVRTAQSDAGSGRKPQNCDETLEGFRFQVDTISPLSYRILAQCTDENVVVKTVSLPEISIDRMPTPNPVLFYPLHQGTNIVGSTSFTISSTSASNTETLYISSSGEIR